MRKICIILMILGISFFLGCASGRCCFKYDKSGNDAKYCIEHSEAVRKYLGLASTMAELRIRVMNFESFMKKISDLRRVSQIESVIRSEYVIPGFWKHYLTNHNYADRNYGLLKNIKAKLIICGFKHGLFLIKEKIK